MKKKTKKKEKKGRRKEEEKNTNRIKHVRNVNTDSEINM